MSVLTYNDYTLEMVRTNQIERTPIYSPDKTEYLYTHFVIDVTCVYNPGATSYDSNGNPTNNNTPTETDVNIRLGLLQPRQQLIFDVGGEDLIFSPQLGKTVDANNGPNPLNCNVTRIIGSTTFLVHYRIETWLTECPPQFDQVNVSNRWQCTDHVDENFMTTKIYRGMAIFRTDMLTALGQSPDHYRNAVFPPIQLGFQRQQIDVTMVPSLNALTYEVIDREQYVCIGDQHRKSGVTHFEAYYQMGTASNEEGGAASPMALGNVAVKVWGERNSSSWQLTIFAVKIAYQKLQLDGNAQNPPILRDVRITQAIHARTVEMTASALTNPGQGIGILNILQLNQDQLNVFVNDFTNPQPYDRGTRGSHQWEMIAQQFKSVCAKSPGLYPSNQSQSSDSPYSSTPPTTVNVGVSDTLPVYNPSYYSDDVYNDYRIDVKYSKDYMMIHAPIATSSSTGRQSSVMQVAAPMQTKTVHWTAERAGTPPKIPIPTPTDSNLKLLFNDTQPAVPGLMPDGFTQIWRVTGTYTYAVQNPPPDGSPLRTGVLPWTSLGFTDNTYGNFDSQIIDNTGTGTTGQIGTSN